MREDGVRLALWVVVVVAVGCTSGPIELKLDVAGNPQFIAYRDGTGEWKAPAGSGSSYMISAVNDYEVVVVCTAGSGEARRLLRCRVVWRDRCRWLGRRVGIVQSSHRGSNHVRHRDADTSRRRCHVRLRDLHAVFGKRELGVLRPRSSGTSGPRRVGHHIGDDPAWRVDHQCDRRHSDWNVRSCGVGIAAADSHTDGRKRGCRRHRPCERRVVPGQRHNERRSRSRREWLDGQRPAPLSRASSSDLEQLWVSSSGVSAETIRDVYITFDGTLSTTDVTLPDVLTDVGFSTIQMGGVNTALPVLVARWGDLPPGYSQLYFSIWNNSAAEADGTQGMSVTPSWLAATRSTKLSFDELPPGYDSAWVVNTLSGYSAALGAVQQTKTAYASTAISENFNGAVSPRRFAKSQHAPASALRAGRTRRPSCAHAGRVP